MSDERCGKCGAVQPATAMVCATCGWSFAAEALRIKRPEDSGDEQRARLRREDGRDQIWFGAVCVIAGGLITVLTHYLASVLGLRTYVIACGVIVVGAIQIIRGLVNRFG